VTVTGILTPLRWNADGQATAVSLATAAERDFEIAKESLTPDVFRCLRELVRVRGTVNERTGASPTLAIEEIQVLEKPHSWNGWDTPENRQRGADTPWRRSP
jgi:hypothetical protein